MSQRAFLRNLARGEAYQAEAPTLWDVDFRTAVAQAELEDREQPGAYHRVRFGGVDGARRHRHRDDPSRADPRVRGARRPSRRRALPRPLRRRGDARRCSACACRCSRTALADPEKGTGIAMICTFGDITDVVWWRELQPPDPQRDGSRRPARRRPARLGRDAIPTPTRAVRASSRARPSSRRGARSSSCCASRRARRRARADHPPGEVLRAGRPSARDRHDAAVVHPQRRATIPSCAPCCSSGAASCAGIRRTCGRATRAGSRASTPTG